MLANNLNQSPLNNTAFSVNLYFKRLHGIFQQTFKNNILKNTMTFSGHNFVDIGYWAQLFSAIFLNTFPRNLQKTQIILRKISDWRIYFFRKLCERV